jgi:hypothetical protein
MGLSPPSTRFKKRKKKHLIFFFSFQNHQHSLKMSPMRWQHASDLRRAERGVKSDRAEPANGNVWPIAVYWTFLEVGTPPVRFPVSIDSGSYTLDLPLAGCNGCVHQAPNTDYNPAQSNTSHLISCNEGCPGGSECKNGVCSFSNTYETCVPCKD